VLVGGWPGSGKTTLSQALAAEFGIDCLSKDDFKEMAAKPDSGMSRWPQPTLCGMVGC